jgi:hypothetical protein
MSRTKDYFATYEDPTYDRDGLCESDVLTGVPNTNTGSMAFAQMIDHLTQKPELEFD